MTSSAIYMGSVMHRRFRPKMHQLRYRIFSLLLDLDEIDELDRRLAFFSHGRFNLLSFHDHDHGDGSNMPLRAQALRSLRQVGISDVGRIRLLAMPRVFGFVFNPLSIYFCDRPQGGLAAILYEVHNTFSERHTYVLPADECDGIVRQRTDKSFRVSPFLPMDLSYSFRVQRPGDYMKVAITVTDDTGPILAAVHSARGIPLTDRAILGALRANPLMTVKVIGGILWEAGKLHLKGVRAGRSGRKADSRPARARTA